VAYITLGSRTLTATADTTGLNTGNFTSYFSSAVLAVKNAYYEIYSISVTGLTQISSVVIYVNNNQRSSATLFGNAEWDPAQVILMTAADELVVAWNLASTGTAPVTTIWLRYDTSAVPGSGF
jgi:hypothetical protein